MIFHKKEREKYWVSGQTRWGSCAGGASTRGSVALVGGTVEFRQVPSGLHPVGEHHLLGVRTRHRRVVAFRPLKHTGHWSCHHVWPQTQFISVCHLSKIIDLPRAQIKMTQHWGRYYSLSFRSATTSSESQNLEGILELTWHPSSAHNLTTHIASRTTYSRMPPQRSLGE